MSTISERIRDSEITQPFRDLDIKTLSSVGSLVESYPDSHFVLTGSWAVEALTGQSVKHNDLDANVFTAGLKKNKTSIERGLVKIEIAGGQLRLFRETDDILEYDLIYKNDGRQIRLELQFIELSNVLPSDGDQKVFKLGKGSDEAIEVPTVIANLLDSKGNDYEFRVKSLSYQVASWALRISGFALDPKRDLRGSDFKHLKLLLSRGYRKEDVISAMSKHPQMPEGLSEDSVFQRALEVVSSY